MRRALKWSLVSLTFLQVYGSQILSAQLFPPCTNGTGSCTVPHVGIGCSDACCCEIVCTSDPYCCDTQWDFQCAGEAPGSCPFGIFLDCNSNGTPDVCDIAQGSSHDCNGNNVPDECDISSHASADCNSNGIPDDCELVANDCNANGVPDECDIANCPPGNPACADCGHDGRPDICDPDLDGDGIPDVCDNCPTGPNQTQANCDGVGPGDACDSPLVAVGIAAGKKNR